MGITHLSGLEVAGVPTMGMGGLPPFTGNWYFVDTAHGSDGNEGTADSPFATIYKAYAKARSGYNDVIVLVGDGSTAGTARMSVALAASVDSTATTGTVTWAKNALHLIGLASPTGINTRARFAPPTGTYTAATFGNSGNMFNVTASGCCFLNFSVWGGFSTGATGCITWKDSGSRNYYNSVHIAGLADAASAQNTASRSITLTACQESTFERCTFGIDTVTRTVANTTLEFLASGGAGCARLKFIECDFPLMTSAATALAVYGAISTTDRWIKFDRCVFLNNVKSTSTTMTAMTTLTGGGSPNGLVIFKDCTAIGATDWGTTFANMYVDGAAPTADTSGIALAMT